MYCQKIDITPCHFVQYESQQEPCRREREQRGRRSSLIRSSPVQELAETAGT